MTNSVLSPHECVLVGGGARSGKSAFALRRAFELGRRRIFVATAEARDEEMVDRIDQHQLERGEHFQTIEAARELPRILGELHGVDVVVVDCLTLWISNEMWGEDGELRAFENVSERLNDLVLVLQALPFHVVLVSNEVGMGLVPMDAIARAFRDHVGWLHGRIAEQASEVYLATMGCLLCMKPKVMTLPGGSFAPVENG